MNTISIIAVLLSIIVFLTILLIGLNTNLLKEVNKKESPYSFSRFQLWIWTMIISPTFVINWGLSNTHIPNLNETTLVLLAIPVGIGFTANLISNTQLYGSKTKSQKSDLQSKSFFSDILIDSNGQFSIVRLQQFIFTLVYIIIYIAMFFRDHFNYPDFDKTAYLLMGISGSTYLIGKGLEK